MLVLRRKSGFALPTVLLASTILLTVLTVAVAAASSVTTSLRQQYLERLSREASESMIARVRSCLDNGLIPAGFVRMTSDASNCAGQSAESDFNTPPTASNSIMYDSATRVATRAVAQLNWGQDRNIVQIIGRSYQLRANGSVWRTSTTYEYIRISSLVGARAVSFGYSASGTYFVTLTNDYVARGIGANTLGQLGIGNRSNTTLPQTIRLPSGVSVSSTQDPAIFTNFLNVGQAVGIIGDDGQAYFSGPNNYGQMGNGTTTGTPPGVFVKFNLPDGENAVYLAPIAQNNYVITDQGNIYAAGICSSGTLGNGTSGSCGNASTPVRVNGGNLPTPNLSNPATIPVAITGDGDVRHVRMRDGSVYGWGRGNDAGGALAVNSQPTAIVNRPLKVVAFNAASFGAGSADCIAGDTSTARCIVDVQETSRTSFVLANDGTVWAAGDNSYGMVGQSPVGGAYSTYRQISLPSTDNKATQISADAWQVAILTSQGNVYTVGLNRGEAGCGTPTTGSSGSCPTEIITPVRFRLPTGVRGTFISNTSINTAGEMMNTYVIGDDGKVYGAGDNRYGQLGNGCAIGTTACANVVGTPIAMQVFTSDLRAARVQAGRGTAVITSATGTIFTVGYNDAGQLGDGTTTSNSTPRANRFTNDVPITVF